MQVSDEELEGFISGRSLVSLRRDGIDSRSLQAVPIAYSDQLLLVEYICDFRLDGQLIIRREDITSITCTETDKFQRQLLDDQGLIDQIDFQFNASLSSFPALLDSQPHSSLVILEREELDDSDFWIGRYIDSDSSQIRMHEFSGAANWDEELTSIAAIDVTCCQLNTNYIKFYADYFSSNPAAKIQ